MGSSFSKSCTSTTTQITPSSKTSPTESSTTMADAYLGTIAVAPPNAIFDLTTQYNNDEFAQRLNLGVGAYRDADGNPWVLPVVKEAERRILAQLERNEINHEYLPISGLKEFVELTCVLATGDNSTAFAEKLIDGVQCISGTGSLRTMGEFSAKFNPNKDIYVSDPTWGNHGTIFDACGLTVKKYRYFDPTNCGLDFEAMKTDLQAASDGATILFHSCAHNPTGVDPSVEQWKELAALSKAKHFTAVFDAAYIGFATGSPDIDSASYRIFAEEKIPLFITQSYSKNFGLYNERTGCLVAWTPSAAVTKAITSQVKLIVRANWSNPPAHGARIVATVLGDPEMKRQWYESLTTMSSRINLMRKQLFDALTEKQTPGTWGHITKQIGMFSFTGLTPSQVAFIKEKYHIYMLSNGRVNMCGLTEPTVDYLATAIHDAVTNSKL